MVVPDGDATGDNGFELGQDGLGDTSISDVLFRESAGSTFDVAAIEIIGGAHRLKITENRFQNIGTVCKFSTDGNLRAFDFSDNTIKANAQVFTQDGENNTSTLFLPSFDDNSITVQYNPSALFAIDSVTAGFH